MHYVAFALVFWIALLNSHPELPDTVLTIGAIFSGEVARYIRRFRGER